MSAVNLDNYEAYVLDYLEGRLGDAEEIALREFIMTHPELEIDLTDGGLPNLDAAIITFENPGQLLKDVPDADDTVVLEFLEGLMDAKQAKTFEHSLLHNPQLSSRLGCFKKAKLLADTVVFEKQLLLKDRPGAVEERVLDYEEGLMSAKEQMAFELDLQRDPSLAAIQRAYRNSVLQPDMETAFTAKKKLYRSGKVIALVSLRGISRVAAALVLLVSMVVLFWPSDETGKTTAVVQLPPQTEAPADPPQVESAPEPGIKNSAMEMKADKAEIPAQRLVAAAKKPGKQQEAGLDSLRQAPAPEPLVASVKSDSAAGRPVEEAIAKQEPVKVISDLQSLRFTEDDEMAADSSDRRNLWQRIVNVATQFSRLGVKGLEAEKEKEYYRLSINAFTVEKKFSRL